MTTKERIAKIGETIRQAEAKAQEEGATETLALIKSAHEDAWKLVHELKDDLGFDKNDFTVFSGGGGKGDPKQD